MSPEELVTALYNGGYAGAVLTNHFTGGNTGISRDLPWADFVREYELDFERCKKAAEEYDVDIIFGVEDQISGGLEILAYGVTPEILYAHPELREHKYEDWRKVADEHEFLLIQAHPFRERDYIFTPGIIADDIDGIEVFNYCNLPQANEKAAEWAKSHPEIILTSGADAHATDKVASAGISTNKRIRNGQDLISLLKTGDYETIIE